MKTPMVSAWYECVPGEFHSGAAAAMMPAASRESMSSSWVNPPSTPGRPPWWLSSWATVMFSLPAAANSGQYSATGASRSSTPSCTSSAMTSAPAPLEQENTPVIDSAVQSFPTCMSSTRFPSR